MKCDPGEAITVTNITEAYRETARRGRRDELILTHLPLVRHLLGKMAADLPAGVDLENLESAGVLGLVQAAASFDPDRETQFKTYAYTRVRGAIIDELRRNSPLPQSMLETVARVRRAHRTLTPPVTVEMLARATSLTTDEVSDCLAAVRLTRMLSLGDGRQEWATRLDDETAAPEAALEREETANLLRAAVDALPPQEATAVTLYYREDLRLKEIGQVLNLSESRVSRILNAALFHLTEYFRVRA
jgi:RNA polymerase sigma factor for flagellar operon FliA